mmetsp:Transcript_17162/g.25419  ORF Transcript_17162/g.25419 Transcript_17162/m.25419 type:complete len:267 (+) Transcript_17162:46-846(+)
MGRNMSKQVALIAVLVGAVTAFQQPSRNVLITRVRQAPPSQPPSAVLESVHIQKQSTQSTTLFSTQSDNDPLVYRASQALLASSWLSWWSQVILTVISAVTFIFARNVMEASLIGPMGITKVAPKFILPGVGIVFSTMSIIWTWGGRRLAKRFLRRTNTTQVEAANLLRRVIKVGASINLIGLFTSIFGAQFIIGTLVAKSMQNAVGFGVGIGGGVVSAQTLQPLDLLVVQANTNMLTSHFVSLACLLWLTRMVDKLDPPSLEEDL